MNLSNKMAITLILLSDFNNFYVKLNAIVIKIRKLSTCTILYLIGKISKMRKDWVEIIVTLYCGMRGKEGEWFIIIGNVERG